jgi:uncharacterized protein (TIGR02421 family)
MVRKLHLKADAKLAEIEGLMPFSLVNPENGDEIKKQFLKTPFEPELKYPQKPLLDNEREQLRKLKCGRTKLGRLLASEKEQLQKKAAMIDAIGTSAYGKACEEVYGAPDKQLVRQAQELLLLKPERPAKKIRFDEVRQIMKRTFELLGFSYAVRRSPMVSSARVLQAKHRVELKAKERFSRTFAYRLAVHEIATHALRSENGRNCSLTIFSRGTPDYLATEEGLAAYNEERAGVMTTDILRNYAGRVIAVHTARSHSFVETFNVLKEHFSKQDAYKLTLRAKRGTSGADKGACTKDHLYLKGYLAIKDHMARGGSLKQLWAAKISLDEMESLAKSLPAPKHIPEPVIEWVRHEVIKTHHGQA